MEEEFLLTNVRLADALRPLHEHLLKLVGAVDPSEISEMAERELDLTIEEFARRPSLDLINSCSRSAKAALMRRILMAAAAGAMWPNNIMLRLPPDVDDGQQRTYAIFALHRDREALVRALQTRSN